MARAVEREREKASYRLIDSAACATFYEREKDRVERVRGR